MFDLRIGVHTDSTISILKDLESVRKQLTLSFFVLNNYRRNYSDTIYIYFFLIFIT